MFHFRFGLQLGTTSLGHFDVLCVRAPVFTLCRQLMTMMLRDDDLMDRRRRRQQQYLLGENARDVWLKRVSQLQMA